MSDNQLSLPGLVADMQVEWVWMDTSVEEIFVSEFPHTTVMRDEVVALLDLPGSSVVVDATCGGGGHSEAILVAHPGARVIALDRDAEALRAARARLSHYGDRITFVHAAFADLPSVLERLEVGEVDGLIADLGVSSPQLDNSERGMSFRASGPIDMRMDTSSGITALDLIQSSSDDELADILYEFGEERRSRRIARSIRKAELAGELSTTLDLRRAVVRAVGPARVGGVDPATRTFQALRIAVNDEMGQLTRLLSAAASCVRPGGAAALISFHSLEDRLVKRAFASPLWQPRTKKPRVASDAEASQNPRSRSAKLRVATRTDVVEV